MARYTGTVEAPHNAEEVWHYLADLRSAEEWDPSVDGVKLVLGEPRTESARYDLEVRFGGRSINIPYRVAELDPPHRVVFEAETDSVSVRDEARIEPKGPAASSVTWDAGPAPARNPEGAGSPAPRDLPSRRRGSQERAERAAS